MATFTEAMDYIGDPENQVFRRSNPFGINPDLWEALFVSADGVWSCLRPVAVATMVAGDYHFERGAGWTHKRPWRLEKQTAGEITAAHNVVVDADGRVFKMQRGQLRFHGELPTQ